MWKSKRPIEVRVVCYPIEGFQRTIGDIKWVIEVRQKHWWGWSRWKRYQDYWFPEEAKCAVKALLATMNANNIPFKIYTNLDNLPLTPMEFLKVLNKRGCHAD